MTKLKQKLTVRPGDIIDVSFAEEGMGGNISVERGEILASYLTPKGEERAVVRITEHANVDEYLCDDSYLGESFVVRQGGFVPKEWFAVHGATTPDPDKGDGVVPLTIYGYGQIGEVCECRGVIVAQWRTWKGNERAIIHTSASLNIDYEVDHDLLDRAFYAKPFSENEWWVLHRLEVLSLTPSCVC